MRYAIVEGSKVSNVVEWDGISAWHPDDGAEALPLDASSPVAPGWLYDGANFTPPSISEDGEASPSP